MRERKAHFENICLALGFKAPICKIKWNWSTARTSHACKRWLRYPPWSRDHHRNSKQNGPKTFLPFLTSKLLLQLAVLLPCTTTPIHPISIQIWLPHLRPWLLSVTLIQSTRHSTRTGYPTLAFLIIKSRPINSQQHACQDWRNYILHPVYQFRGAPDQYYTAELTSWSPRRKAKK